MKLSEIKALAEYNKAQGLPSQIELAKHTLRLIKVYEKTYDALENIQGPTQLSAGEMRGIARVAMNSVEEIMWPE